LLTATILSAQSTDARINLVSPVLFAAYPTPEALAAASLVEVEEIVLSTGFYKSKAKNIVAMAQTLVANFDSEVPSDVGDLTSLPGVGRKTANVVLNVAFGQPTMAVDTHIFRVGNRTGMAPGKNPLDVELNLLKVIPPEYAVQAHHWLILHGRYTCKARTPMCQNCAIANICKYKDKTKPAK
jgi:endonuclease-3